MHRQESKRMPEEPEKINFEEDLLKLFMRAIIFC
jgi:hypothetical protein